jgi:bifunctional non-homologous end joining protein LigD
MDLFEENRVDPMLISEMRVTFDFEDYIFEIKGDGIRCITYLDESSANMHNKRNKMMIPILQELAELHRQDKTKCI